MASTNPATPLITTADLARVTSLLGTATQDSNAITNAIAEFNVSIGLAVQSFTNGVADQISTTTTNCAADQTAVGDALNQLLSQSGTWYPTLDSLEAQLTNAQEAHFDANFGEVHGVSTAGVTYKIDGTRHGNGGSDQTVNIGNYVVLIPTTSGNYYVPASLAPNGLA